MAPREGSASVDLETLTGPRGFQSRRGAAQRSLPEESGGVDPRTRRSPSFQDSVQGRLLALCSGLPRLPFRHRQVSVCRDGFEPPRRSPAGCRGIEPRCQRLECRPIPDRCPGAGGVGVSPPPLLAQSPSWGTPGIAPTCCQLHHRARSLLWARRARAGIEPATSASWRISELNRSRVACKASLRPSGSPWCCAISRPASRPRLSAASVGRARIEHACTWSQARWVANTLTPVNLGDRPVTIRHRLVHSEPCRATTPRPPCLFRRQGSNLHEQLQRLRTCH